MTSGGAVSLRCPDCAKAVGALEDGVQCRGCGRRFAPAEGVWDLLPAVLGAPTRSEDRLHEQDAVPTWRRLFYHKRDWIEWCDARWLPELIGPGARTFLEVGGGLCYASALAKARLPRGTVVATDVSPRYLRRHALAVGRILGAPADVYAAADVERLPFEDGQFDAVYSQVVLYRVPDPVRALREIRRVLAPGGRYLGIERASPWALLFREDRTMRARAAARGIAERPLRYWEWERLLRAAGLAAAALRPVPGRRVRSALLRRAGNAVRQIHVAISFHG